MKIDPYKVLGVKEDSSTDEIVDAYYKILFDLKSEHKDRDLANRAFKMLTSTYSEFENILEENKNGSGR